MNFFKFLDLGSEYGDSESCVKFYVMGMMFVIFVKKNMYFVGLWVLDWFVKII